MQVAEINDAGLEKLGKYMDVSTNERAAKAKAKLVQGNEVFCEARGEFYSDLPAVSEKAKTDLRDFVLSGNSALEEVKKHQAPEIAVLACSDSRADPAAVFSQHGFNKIFVVRNAGNVFTTEVEESMVVPVSHDAAVIVVCGHYKCGAMNACAKMRKENVKNAVMPAIVGRIDAIAPANVTEADELAKYNVADVLYSLAISENSVLKDAFVANKVKLLGAMYDIDSGKVEFMDFKEVNKLLLNRKENCK